MQVSSQNKVDFPTLYLLRFLRVSPFSNVPLPEGLRAQCKKFQSTKVFVTPPKCNASLLPQNCVLPLFFRLQCTEHSTRSGNACGHKQRGMHEEKIKGEEMHKLT
jgi:hypothetical protein